MLFGQVLSYFRPEISCVVSFFIFIHFLQSKLFDGIDDDEGCADLSLTPRRSIKKLVIKNQNKVQTDLIYFCLFIRSCIFMFSPGLFTTFVCCVETLVATLNVRILEE